MGALTDLVIGLGLVLVLWLQRQLSTTVQTVRTNDLGHLPQILDTLQRIERQQAEAFARILTLLEHGEKL